jgi:hypothetical protein
MKLPEVENADKYVGLYVVDFGEHCGVGFTAQEVTELLESERFKEVKVYKIYNAYPDGRMELKGVPQRTFELESGMFFYASEMETARSDYKRLIDFAVDLAPPARAKVHLAQFNEEQFVTALIYPAEYDDEFSRWLLDGDYKTEGRAEGGIGAVEVYYEKNRKIFERYQLFGESPYMSRSGEELLTSVRRAVQR